MTLAADCQIATATLLLGFIDPEGDIQSTANARHKHTTASRFCGAAADP